MTSVAIYKQITITGSNKINKINFTIYIFKEIFTLSWSEK